MTLCAGDGRDVLPVLATHPRGRDVRGRLVELDPVLAEVARGGAPAGIEVVTGDAGTTNAGMGAVPADLLLLCGIFGNISEDDIAGTVAAAPSLLASGGTVIWTRHRREPDLTTRLRAWWADAGVVETAFLGTTWSVGAGVLRSAGREVEPDLRLFTFVR